MLKRSKEPSTKHQDKQLRKQKKSPQGEKRESQWVINFVAISNALQSLGKGLCWVFGSLLILEIVVFVCTGSISPKELIDALIMYFSR